MTEPFPGEQAIAQAAEIARLTAQCHLLLLQSEGWEEACKCAVRSRDEARAELSRLRAFGDTVRSEHGTGKARRGSAEERKE